LRTTLEENLNVIRDSIAFVKDAGREVIFDAEHFFDGFRADPNYALACLQVAVEAGADSVVLCDTNGGSLPDWVAQVTTRVTRNVNVKVGVHTHNDAELAVANALSAVQAGAVHIQGTINGYGERCGNANLVSLLPTLIYKLHHRVHAAVHLAELTRLSRQIAEIANITPDAFAPYVGSNAFTHKGGIHASAVARIASSYEHIPPPLVGNHNDIVVSELAGWSNVLARAENIGVRLQDSDKDLLQEIKNKEARGVHLEAAEGSFELMLRRREQAFEPAFVLEDFRVEARRHQQQEMACQATCKLRIGHETLLTVAEAQGPVAAIDAALRRALIPYWPELRDVKLSDYTVRILDAEKATAATTRVIIEAVWKDQTWRTVGASENIIDASAQALVESFELFIVKRRGQHYGDTAA
jgi:2-isopropylmalate synthase